MRRSAAMECSTSRDSGTASRTLLRHRSGASGILAAVADGMGGLVNSGAVSQALTETLAEEFTPDPRFPLPGNSR